MLKINIGDVCCSIKCSDEIIFSRLWKLYDGFFTEKPADVSIELEVVNRCRNLVELKAALNQKITDREEILNIILKTEYDAASRTAHVKAENSLFSPALDFTLMNHLLAPAYYTACEAKYSGKPPAMLVHCSGILRNGQVLLFCGPSEIGKTTAARLCSEKQGQVMNDEMLLVSYQPDNNGNRMVKGVPIIGGLSQRLNTAAPLGCVFMLKQSQKTTARRLSRLEAYLRFMRQIISPAPLGKVNRPAIFSLIAEFSDEITAATPFYELEFRLDAESLWNITGEVQRTLMNGG